MNNNLTNCFCGRAPKFSIREIAFNVPYIMLSCDCNLGISTFATRKEEYCMELWQSTIRYMREKRLKDTKNKQDD